MTPIEALVAETLKLLRPAPKLKLSEWAEQHFVLPERSSAKAGRFRLWPYQREMIDAMGDPAIERVSVMKSARIGFTKGLMAALTATAAEDPCAIILLVPTDDDARGFAVDEIEPAFEASPTLKGLIRSGRLDGRNTLTMKSIVGGGSLKILAARAPRNLRRHDAKKLFVDEADGMEITNEGDPILLAEKRTLAHPDRKIVVGSTPTVEGASVVERLYGESDQRVFEVPCPHCSEFTEILWKHIRWPEGRPEDAAFLCPHCGVFVEEKFKHRMVHAGRWRATNPEALKRKRHAGFRINTLVSLLHNAAWGKLAQEYVEAKRAGPAELQVFANTVEGRTWKTTLDSVSEEALATRVEAFGLERIPADVLAITAGVDVQEDRLEITIIGWAKPVTVKTTLARGKTLRRQSAYALGHHVIWGSTLDETTWAELDTLLGTKWEHPKGWKIGIDATAVDSGDGNRTDQVYEFCGPRLARRIYAIKGAAGARRIWEAAKKVKDGARLFIVGVDQVKPEVANALALDPYDETGKPVPGAVHVSDDLPTEWFDQVTGERRVIRYVRTRTIIEWQPRKRGQRVEGLDCMVYGFAVRHSQGFKATVNWAEREARTAEFKAEKRGVGSWAKRLNA